VKVQKGWERIDLCSLEGGGRRCPLDGGRSWWKTVAAWGQQLVENGGCLGAAASGRASLLPGLQRPGRAPRPIAQPSLSASGVLILGSTTALLMDLE
jgi:hypothetical protein